MPPENKIIMPDITIGTAMNGFIVEQRKAGYDWTNRWVARSIEELATIIVTICEEFKKEGK